MMILLILNALQRAAIRLVFDGPYLGPLAPWLFAFGMGRWPKRVRHDAQ